MNKIKKEQNEKVMNKIEKVYLMHIIKEYFRVMELQQNH